MAERPTPTCMHGRHRGVRCRDCDGAGVVPAWRGKAMASCAGCEGTGDCSDREADDATLLAEAIDLLRHPNEHDVESFLRRLT